MANPCLSQGGMFLCQRLLFILLFHRLRQLTYSWELHPKLCNIIVKGRKQTPLKEHEQEEIHLRWTHRKVNTLQFRGTLV